MRIIGFAQTVRLDREPSEGYEIRVLLDSGEEASIPTNEETVQALIQLSHGIHKKQDVAPEEMVPNVPEPHFPQDYIAATGDEDTSVFGGDVVESAPIPTPVRRVATPAADEMGYPIVPQQSENMPRPAFLSNDDEDGQQI
jgi:hypothetical protein